MTGFRILTVGDIPILLSPWFLLLFVLNLDSGFGVAIHWTALVGFSVLIHELGHAFTARRFKLAPSVVIHAFGGFCVHQPALRNRDEALIVAAGPAAGLVLGVLSILAVWKLPESILLLEIVPGIPVNETLFLMIYLNIFWSFINLIPFWPLDGGLLFRLLMLRFFPAVRAEKITHITSIILGILLVIAAFKVEMRFGAFLAGYYIWHNIRAMRGEVSSGVVRLENKFAKELLAAAKANFDAGDYREAARLAHQARSEKNLAPEFIEELWKLLGIATARMGDHKQAISYLRRAKPDAEIAQTWAEILLAHGSFDDLASFAESPVFTEVPGDLRRAIEQRLAASEPSEGEYARQDSNL